MDQQILKIIKAVANQLPVVMQQTSEEHHVDGAELIEQGHYELEEGEKVQPGVKYKQHMPVLLAANHVRRMKHEYEKHGNQGILNYVEKIKQLALANAN